MNRDLTVEEFCDIHDACEDGRTWALANCRTMREAWDTAKPEWLIWIATRRGVLPDSTLRLLAVGFAESVSHLLTDERSRNAIAVARRHADGLATDEELAAASAAAWAAAGAATCAAERAAAWAAESAAAWAEFARITRQHTPDFSGGVK